MRLLLVEDDDALADAVIAALARRAIAADRAGSAGDAEAMLAAAEYSALLLDLGLPDEDGVTLLRRLRASGATLPVIVATARGATGERIAGLDAGADDYLVKPFDMAELEARLRAVMRRQRDIAPETMRIGNVAFDPRTRAMTVAGAGVALSQREGDVAELLLRRAGRVVTRALVEDQLFGLSETPGSNAIEVYVHRLRRKLEQAGADVRIETIRGVGYLARTGA